jgi:hypothetical protein
VRRARCSVSAISVWRHVCQVFAAAAATAVWIASASAETKPLPEATRFCPSWAEAHERTLASLNHGRSPFPVRWKSCILLKKGTNVDVLASDDYSTEIIIKGKHWFTDEQLF